MTAPPEPTPQESETESLLKMRAAEYADECQRLYNAFVGRVFDNGTKVRAAMALALARARHAGAVAERERCASVCETHVWRRPVEWWLESTKQFVASVAARECAAAIRSLAPAEKAGNYWWRPELRKRAALAAPPSTAATPTEEQ